MTDEELRQLKLKYEGKLARIFKDGSSYSDDSNIGIVEEILRDRYETDYPAVRFHNQTVWYFNRNGWLLEVHPSQI